MTDTGPPPLTLPPHLDHDALAVAQQETLSTPRRPYGLPARVLLGAGRLHRHHPCRPAPRSGPAHPRPGGAGPDPAGQRAMASADPGGAGGGLGEKRIPLALLLDPTGHRVRLLPAVVAAVRAAPGLVPPAQR